VQLPQLYEGDSKCSRTINTTNERERGNEMNELEKYAENKTKVRVLFSSGKSKWGWIHQYQGRWWLTRGNRVGFSMDTAIKIEEVSV
jgi:hypothetical protein